MDSLIHIINLDRKALTTTSKVIEYLSALEKVTSPTLWMLSRSPTAQ